MLPAVLFTALHRMPARISHEKAAVCLSVSPSVCLSVVTKQKKVQPKFLNHVKEHLS